jgi:hypothetical protein
MSLSLIHGQNPPPPTQAITDTQMDTQNNTLFKTKLNGPNKGCMGNLALDQMRALAAKILIPSNII